MTSIISGAPEPEKLQKNKVGPIIWDTLYVTVSGLPAAQDKTLPAGAVSLEDEANWLVAWQKNLSRQSLYNNIVKEVFNSMTRIIGWALISFVSRYSVTTACLAKV